MLTQSGLFFSELRLGLELEGKGFTQRQRKKAQTAGAGHVEAWSERRKKRLVTSSPTMKERFGSLECMGRHKATTEKRICDLSSHC